MLLAETWKFAFLRKISIPVYQLISQTKMSAKVVNKVQEALKNWDLCGKQKKWPQERK